MIVVASYFPLVFNFVLFALVFAYCIKSGNWLIGTFVVATFFFAYTTFPALLQLQDEMHHWIHHLQPVGLHLVVALFFLGVLLAAVASEPISETYSFLGRLPKLSVFALVIFSVSIPFVYWQDVESEARSVGLAFKGMVSSLGMTVVALALTVLIRNNLRSGQYYWPNMYWILFYALSLCTMVAFWEIASQHAWVVNRFRDNLDEFRASSMFRNPNLFGVWAAAMAFAASFAAFHKVRYLVHPILALSAVAIFLSGSRTALILALICLALPIALAIFFRLSVKASLGSLVAFSLYFCAALAIPFVGIFIYPDAVTSSFSGFYALALRYISIPVDLIYWIQGTGAPEHIEISVSGRFFLGGTVDNGFLSLLGDGWWMNYFGAGSWALFWISIAWAGLRRLVLSPSHNGIYAVTALAYCILIGFTMRAYQIFPAWAFVALMLSLFLLWYLNDGRSYA